jgi:pimeloyl-ACP methyl ester carboxylesterase
VEALAPRYRLILFDARGHGRSDKPHRPEAYGHRALVGDVVALLYALGLPRVYFYGYSLGGVVGFHLARCALHRVGAFIIAGAGLQEPEAYPRRDTVDGARCAGWLRVLAGVRAQARPFAGR